MAVLDDIVSGINNSVSRSHGMRPADVTYKDESKIFRKLFPEYKPRLQGGYKYMFEPGDRVRHSKFRSPFHKSYFGNYSNKIYTVSQRIPRSPPVYRLETSEGGDFEGTWYGPELIKVDEENEDI